MKQCILAACLLVMALGNLFGEIINGYEKDLPGLRNSLARLESILADDACLTGQERKKIKSRIRAIIGHLIYFQVTDTMLRQFRAIAPELYDEINTLADRNGKVIDVYVRFIPEAKATYRSEGLSAFSQSTDDRDRCHSEYGNGSVSVKVWIAPRALLVLSHEFGHLKYVVPNLASYMHYYRKRYRSGFADGAGHRCDDKGGRSATAYERRFRSFYSRYLREDFPPVTSPLALVNPVKRDVLKNLDDNLRFVAQRSEGIRLLPQRD